MIKSSGLSNRNLKTFIVFLNIFIPTTFTMNANADDSRQLLYTLKSVDKTTTKDCCYKITLLYEENKLICESENRATRNYQFENNNNKISVFDVGDKKILGIVSWPWSRDRVAKGEFKNKDNEEELTMSFFKEPDKCGSDQYFMRKWGDPNPWRWWR